MEIPIIVEVVMSGIKMRRLALEGTVGGMAPLRTSAGMS